MENIKLNTKKVSELNQLQINSEEASVSTLDHTQDSEFKHLFISAYRNMVKAFDFGGWTEYYDESGSVVMTSQIEDDESITFEFGTGDSYNYKSNDLHEVLLEQQS